MKNKKQTIYQIYIEGALHDETTSAKKANRIRKEAESEGWNVTVIKFKPTVIGHLGIKV